MYQPREITTTPRALRGRFLYWLAQFEDSRAINGTGQTPLDAIRDLLDAEENAKLEG